MHQTGIKAGTHTWDTFIAVADKYFSDPLETEKAMTMIKEMKMLPGETCKAFFTRFDKMWQLAKMEDPHHDASLVHLLEGILPKKVVKNV